MNSSPSRLLRAVAALALALPLALPARAALIGADAATAHDAATAPAAATPDQEREQVRQFLDRASVRERLQSMGVDGLAAGSRVDALTDAEVHALAQRIDALPAGGRLSEMDIILVVLIALLVVIVL